MAVFHCTDSVPIGPVRSGRTTDIPLFLQLNRTLFARSGANNEFARRIRASNMVDVGYDAATGQYFRQRGRPSPYNLFLQGYTRVLEGHAPPDAAAPAPLFTYRKHGADPGGKPARRVHVVFGTSAGSAPVDWEWTGTGWARSQAGTPHVDAAGRRIEVDNVIIQFVRYVNTDVTDQFGVLVPEAFLVTEGDAWILTAGRVIEARWRKTSAEAVIQYRSRLGRPINLTPGRTWVALPPQGGATITG
jgi:hypothetical protein